MTDQFPREDGWRPVRFNAIWTEQTPNGTEIVFAFRSGTDPYLVLMRTAGPLYGFERDCGDGQHEYAFEQRTQLLHGEHGARTVSRMSIIHGDELAAKLAEVQRQIESDGTDDDA
jgi:hypothetical protein